MEYYTRPDDSFPLPEEIIRQVKKVPDIKAFRYELKKFLWFLKRHDKTVYERRIYLFAVFELIKKNIDILYHNEHMNQWYLSAADHYIRDPHFAEYLEHFKMKCVKSYYENKKHQARKKLITFYMNHCEGLCFDVVEYTMKFY